MFSWHLRVFVGGAPTSFLSVLLLLLPACLFLLPLSRSLLCCLFGLFACRRPRSLPPRMPPWFLLRPGCAKSSRRCEGSASTSWKLSGILICFRRWSSISRLEPEMSSQIGQHTFGWITSGCTTRDRSAEHRWAIHAFTMWFWASCFVADVVPQIKHTLVSVSCERRQRAPWPSAKAKR